MFEFGILEQKKYTILCFCYRKLDITNYLDDLNNTIRET